MKHIAKTGAKAGLWTNCPAASPATCRNKGTHVKDGDLFTARRYYEEQTGVKIARITEVPENAVHDLMALPKAEFEAVQQREWDAQQATSDRNRAAREKRVQANYAPGGKYHNVIRKLDQAQQKHNNSGAALATSIFSAYGEYEAIAKADTAKFIRDEEINLSQSYYDKVGGIIRNLARNDDERDAMMLAASDISSLAWQSTYQKVAGHLPKQSSGLIQSRRALAGAQILKKLAEQPYASSEVTHAYLDSLTLVYSLRIEEYRSDELAKKRKADKQVDEKKAAPAQTDDTAAETKDFDTINVGSAFDRIRNIFPRRKAS